MAKTLYICYFGLREPLVQTQVLPYLRELSVRGVEVHLLTFEPDKNGSWSPEIEFDVRESLEKQGIQWACLPYHKRPSMPATAYDVLVGARKIRELSERFSIDILHARSHVPMAMALLAQRRHQRVIFDIRGLLADEYADAGVWKKGGAPYKLVKMLEDRGVREAASVVVLTERMRDWLVTRKGVPRDKVKVIPCCVDLSRYDSGSEVCDGFEVIYAGSVTGLYLLEEMGRFFVEVSRRYPEARLRLLTKTPRQNVLEKLSRLGIEDEKVEVTYVEPQRVPLYLRRARVGLSFRKPTFSQIAASPTKIAEYLASGLPVVSNAGIGDVDALLERERVGVLVKDFHAEAYAQAADKLVDLLHDPELAERCRRAARRYFDLKSVGGERYFEVYRRLISIGEPAPAFHSNPTDV